MIDKCLTKHIVLELKFQKSVFCKILWIVLKYLSCSLFLILVPFELIEEKLLQIYEAPIRRNLGGFEWAEPIRIAKPDIRSVLQNTNLIDEAF